MSCLALVGCGESVQTSSGAGKPAYSVSVDQLASRLGLSVRQINKAYYELTDANNRVLLFAYKDGRVYVNGKNIGTVGAATEYGGTHYVSEIWVPRIRQHLLTSYASKPQTSYTPEIASGTVVIDPGHGGKDPGTTSVLGDQEKKINLQIAQHLADQLRTVGINVTMTREGDTYPELEERAALANRINADLFVSIHCDSNGDSVHQGFTIYVARQASWSSKKTASAIKTSLSNSGVSSKGVRNADYRVLVQTKCPAVLVECGFMSNYDEASRLRDPWYQKKLAQAIAEGIIKSL